MRTVRGGKRAGREGGLVVGAAGRGGWWEVRQGRDGGGRGGMRGEGGEDRLAEIGSWRMERRGEGGGEDVGKRGRAWRAGRWRAAAAIVLWWRMRGRDRSEGLVEVRLVRQGGG